jgi:exopolyphosphatase/guanosine-5'-triphosphate,3'-diphosphate pyrophosphatase
VSTNGVRRVATIDLGTNTALLLVAEQRGTQLVAVRDVMEIVRLGEGLDQSGELGDAAMERTMVVLERFAAIVKQLDVPQGKFVAITTEAVRKASNGAAFVERVNTMLYPACEMQIIDGDREAELSFAAVRDSFPHIQGPRTVVDIGGGSTEIIVGDVQVSAKRSVPIGSVRLTERLLKHDPPTMQELTAVRMAVDEQLALTPKPVGPVIGIAGTVTTLAAMAQKLDTYDALRVHGSRLTFHDVVRLVDELAGKPIAERRRLPGLHPKRADVIVAGGLILERVLERAGWADCLVSDRGIRWGLAAELAR